MPACFKACFASEAPSASCECDSDSQALCTAITAAEINAVRRERRMNRLLESKTARVLEALAVHASERDRAGLT
jgi:hypothetical protein